MYKSFMLSIFTLLVLNGCGEGKDPSSTTNGSIVNSDITAAPAQKRAEKTTQQVVAQQPQQTATSASHQQTVQPIAPLQPMHVQPQQTAHGNMVTATPPYTSVNHLGLSSTAQPKPQSMSTDKQAATIVSAKQNNNIDRKTESDVAPSIKKTTATLPTEAVPPTLNPVAEHTDEKNNTTDIKTESDVEPSIKKTTAALPTEAVPPTLNPVAEHAEDLWHPEPGPVVLPPEPAKPAIKLVPADIKPIIQVRGNDYPTSHSVLDGMLSQQYDQPITALWQQDGKPEPLGKCELAGAKNTCRLELKSLKLNNKPIKLCLDNGNCASLKLPKVTFIGQLNYKGTVTAELSGFSDNLTTQWYLGSEDDLRYTNDNDYLLSEADDQLSINLKNELHSANFYIHEYLFFCVTDNGNHWSRQCMNVGSQANNFYNMEDLLDTVHKDISLVGGALSEISDKPGIRRIAPVPVLFTSRNERVYRPLTRAELQAIKIQLNAKYVSYRRSSVYAQLPYQETRYPAEKYNQIWHFGDAKSLCGGQNMAAVLPEINTLQELDLAELHDSGWPMGKYWSKSSHNLRDEQWVFDSTDGKSNLEEMKDPMAFAACQTY